MVWSSVYFTVLLILPIDYACVFCSILVSGSIHMKKLVLERARGRHRASQPIRILSCPFSYVIEKDDKEVGNL